MARQEGLTERQKIVAGYLRQGLTDVEIAQILGITRQGARMHRIYISKKETAPAVTDAVSGPAKAGH